MIETQLYGLIGKNISYSFSKKYFTEKFKKLHLKGFSYELFDLENINLIQPLLQNKSLKGFNVTIPYKENIISFLDELSEEAREIAAVNCVKIIGERKIGYNTDAFGFEKSLLLNPKNREKKALILGDGGAAKAVKYVLQKHEIPYLTVARNTDLNFKTLDEDLVKAHQLIIQCTPVGTFPHVDHCLQFPFEALSKNHTVIDLIYNPEITQFLKNAAQQDAKTLNGFYMLEQQAEKAWQIWQSQ